MLISELINKPIKECVTAGGVSAGAVATAMPGGNGFKNGGPGTISRAGTRKKKSKR